MLDKHLRPAETGFRPLGDHLLQYRGDFRREVLDKSSHRSRFSSPLGFEFLFRRFQWEGQLSRQSGVERAAEAVEIGTTIDSVAVDSLDLQ